MRIIDWSSDVCSSDLDQVDLRPAVPGRGGGVPLFRDAAYRLHGILALRPRMLGHVQQRRPAPRPPRRSGDRDVARYREDRKSVVSGKSVSVRVDLVGGRLIKKKKPNIVK